MRTHQKERNLYLYLAGHSAHAPGTLKSLIHGKLRRYKLTNTYHKDFVHFSVLLYRRLLARGYAPHTLQPIFEQAYSKLTSAANPPTPAPAPAPALGPTAAPPPATPLAGGKDPRKLFLHLKYHPADVTRKVVCQLFDKHCSHLVQELDLDQMVIAYSRAKNRLVYFGR